MVAKPTKKKPEERIRARNESKILKAAVELFSRKGFDGTRIVEIAEISGLPKANIYYYFATKEDIYTTLIERLLEGWDRAMELITPDRDPRDALSAYISAKLEYTRTHGAESRFFASEILRGGHFLSLRQKRHIQRVTRERVAVIEGWISEGRMAPIDPRHFFISVWSATQFYTDFELVAALTLEKKRLTIADFANAERSIIGTLLDGCLPK